VAKKAGAFKTVDQIDAAITALDVEVQEIEQWRESITQEIAEAWDGDTSEQQADYVRSQVRLEAAKRRRVMLEQQRRDLRAQQAIKDGQQRAQEIADLEHQRDQAQRQIEKLRAALADEQKRFEAIGAKLQLITFWRRQWAQDEYPDLSEEQRDRALQAFADALATARGAERQTA